MAGRAGRSRSFDAFFAYLHRTYERILRGSLRRSGLTISAGMITVVLAVVLFKLLPSELVPTEDRGWAFGIEIAPEGATLDYTDRNIREIEKRLLALPERRGLFTAIGLWFGGPGSVTNGVMFMLLSAAERARQVRQQQIVQELFPQLMSIPGVLAFVVNPPSLGIASSNGVEYVLQAETYEELSRAVGAMMGEASKLGYLVNLDSDLRLNKPQLDIKIDRERAAGLGVSVADIGTTLETFLAGASGDEFQARNQAILCHSAEQGRHRATPAAIENIYLRGAGGLVQLASVVKMEKTVAPKELNHYNRIRSATITGNLVPGVTLGRALDDLDNIARTALPAGVKHEYAGQSLEYKSSSSGLYFMFLLAIVFIYLVLSAQFESFVHPFTILLTVPLAVFGALLTLYIFGQSLNIYSQIGLIMLVGLVTKNAILIVEFANQLRASGKQVAEAVVEAATIRLRPILMTSFSTIFGVLPIAIGLGAGAESRRPLGLAVVGGLFFSTFLTLVLVPVVYVLLGRFTKVKKRDGGGPENVVRPVAEKVQVSVG